ncbi:MAG: DegT/DnrJ/EryC1/StrS family aminotransferase, partial [Deltaproteobacteria bacterium]|nr:DegT/DnrJ/EryC1/StrS family aminotransferase [Deltaproteobacteria bacterium]
GVLGDSGCLSFNGNKIITTGGGGMLLTNQPQYAEKARHLTTQARIHNVEYIHDDVGYNYRMTNLQAALGVAQLEQLGVILTKKRKIAAHYAEYLSKIQGIRFLFQQPWAESNYWLNTVLCEQNDSRAQHDDVMEKMTKEGIATRSIFSPLHLLRPFKKYSNIKFHVAEGCKGLNLPSSPDLTREALFRVTGTMKRIATRWEKLGTNMVSAA